MSTPLQQRIFEFIRQYIDEQGYSPSLLEVTRALEISPNSIGLIGRSIHALVQEGRLEFYKKGYRNIKIVQPKHLSLPLMGRIAAGKPIEAIANDQWVNLGDILIRDDHFLLEVMGSSMIEENILNGDLIVCKQTNKANEGDIVVALIDGQETTLKRISYKIADQIILIPANSQLTPQAYDPTRIQIQGKYIGLVRMRK